MNTAVQAHHFDHGQTQKNHGHEAHTMPQDQQRHEGLGTIGSVLRFAGTLVLIGAGVSFLFQGFTQFGDLGRYGAFLGFTALLTLAGFFCSRVWRENKSARTFLGLAAATVPVHFSQLGALIYSMRGVEASQSLPQMLTWQGSAGLPTMALASVGLVFSIAVSNWGYKALARPLAKRLVMVAGFGGALLLLPTRDAHVIAPLSAAFTAFLMFFDQKLSGMPFGKTWEARIARMLAWTPLAVLYLRSAIFYPASDLLLGVGFLMLATFIMGYAPRWIRSQRFVCALQATACLPAGLGTLTLLYKVSIVPTLALFLVSFGLLTIAMGRFSVGGGRYYRATGCFMALLGLFSYHMVTLHFGSAFLMMIGGLVAALYSYRHRQQVTFAVGSLGMLTGLGLVVLMTFDQITFGSPWIILAITGMLVLLGAGYLERHAGNLLQKAKQLRATYNSWE